MPQIQKGDTFADGQQVTGARLNQLVDSATILPAIITDQTNLTANTVAAGDSVLLYDASATALREATASDLLNSNIAVTTSSITGGANSDIVITPNDGATVTGATYTSGDGLTVVVTLNSHGLVVNQVVTISGAGSGYNGTFRITAVSANTFTYVMTTAATPATNQSCSYTRQGTVRNAEHAVIGGNVYVAGDSVVTGTSVQTGNVIQSGNTSIGGNLTVTGTTTQTGTVTQNGAVNQTGTVNITGAIQYNGTPVFGLYSITEESISWNQTYLPNGTVTPIWTSGTFTKPVDEIWIFDFILDINFMEQGSTSFVGTAILRNNANTDLISYVNGYTYSASTQNPYQMLNSFKMVYNSGIAYTSEVFKICVKTTSDKYIQGSSYRSGDGVGWKMITTKYKTA